MGGFLTFLLVRFRKTESIMADEEAEVYEEEEERVEEEVEEEPEPEPEPVKEPTPPPPPAPKKKAAKKAPEPEPEEEASGAAGLAKYSPSGEVDQYGFPIIPFGIEGLDYNALCERAKALHQAIWNLEANCYDYQQKFERQNYDMMELAERARQMNRGRRKTPTGHTGLGGSVFPWIAQNFATAPPKISLFSKYERQKDRRTFTERRLIYQDPEDAKAKGLRVEKPIPLPVN